MTSMSRSGGAATTPGEEILLIHIGLAAGTLALGSAGLLWLKGATWLVEHHLLLPAAAHALVVVPGTGGAGLDLPRLAVMAGVALATIVLAVSTARRALTSRTEAGAA